MTDDNGNGRVTMAIIGQRLERVEKLLERMEGKLDGLAHEQQALCLDVNTNKARIENMRDDVDALERKSNLVDSVTGLGAIVAMVLSAIGITK